MWTFALLSFVGCQNQELPGKDFKIETAVFRMDIKRPEWFLPMINTLVHISSGNLKIEPLVAIFDTTIGKSLPKMDGPCRWTDLFGVYADYPVDGNAVFVKNVRWAI